MMGAWGLVAITTLLADSTILDPDAFEGVSPWQFTERNTNSRFNMQSSKLYSDFNPKREILAVLRADSEGCA